MISKLKKILESRGLTISVAESCTGGNLQALLSSIDGSSNYFEGGICCYNISQKVKHLGVDYEVAKPVDCVSQEVADQMASGVCNLFETRLGASTTGYIDKYFYCSIVLDNEIIFRGKFDVVNNRDRQERQLRASYQVLDNILECLI